MSTTLEGARRLVPAGDLDERVAGLGDAVEASTGRLDEQTLAPARGVIERAAQRLRLSADHTVVALAGATGSGKSSTFNALTGLDLADVGVRRPTTSWATACIWGGRDAHELLEWLGIPERHQVVHDSMLDTGDRGLQGLVLLDLPDHDSTEVSHHLVVDRLVELADLVVWVLDPQKYADAALHERFLRPLAGHDEAMLVTLNHVDEIPAERREAVLSDVRRLLAEDGLSDVPVLATSARTGEGIGDLHREIAGRITDKAASRSGVRSDVRGAARSLVRVSGDVEAPTVGERQREAVLDVVGEAAGLSATAEAAEAAATRAAVRATAWPPLALIGRHHDDVATSTSTPASQTTIEARVRDLADSVSGGLSAPWVRSIRAAALANVDRLPERLDRAVRESDVVRRPVPRWCRVVQVVQWVLFVIAVVGAVWWAASAALHAPSVIGIPLPAILLVVGVVLGIGLWLLARARVRAQAATRAQEIRKALRSSVEEVTDELVVGPMEAEVAAYERTREGLRRALASG